MLIGNDIQLYVFIFNHPRPKQWHSAGRIDYIWQITQYVKWQLLYGFRSLKNIPNENNFESSSVEDLSLAPMLTGAAQNLS